MTTKKFICILLLSFGFSLHGNAQNHRNCGTTNNMLYQMERDSSLALKLEQQEIDIQQWIKEGVSTKSVVTIPVVFHVLYAYSPHNVTDAQLLSQLDVLNADYRRTNTDASNTPTIFQSVAADVEIEFCLAQQDPQGNPTSGITRTSTTKTYFDMANEEAKYTSLGGHDAWDRDQYLNIWVVPEIVDGSETGILGYAQFPGGNAATDGVVIGYKYIGTSGSVSWPFNQGRTATHEVGHWFSLYHIWGDDGGGCWGSDQVQDTPNQSDNNYDCPTHPSPSCNNSGDMFMNYMDYTNDECMNIFTQGQKDRMQAVLNTSRLAIKSSIRCQPVSMNPSTQKLHFNIQPNPATNQLVVNWELYNNDNINLQIIDLSGRIVYEGNPEPNHNSITISTFDLSNGIYLLKLSTPTQLGIEKLIIQH